MFICICICISRDAKAALHKSHLYSMRVGGAGRLANNNDDAVDMNSSILVTYTPHVQQSASHVEPAKHIINNSDNQIDGINDALLMRPVRARRIITTQFK